MAAKFRQDPRSQRKSAMDLYKAGVVPLTSAAASTRTASVAVLSNRLDFQ